jgi:hypothetical protein
VGGGRLDRDDGGYHAIQTPDRPGVAESLRSGRWPRHRSCRSSNRSACRLVRGSGAVGPTRRRVFEDCLWPNGGQISFHAAAPCSHLNGCHPRPVNAYPWSFEAFPSSCKSFRARKFGQATFLLKKPMSALLREFRLVEWFSALRTEVGGEVPHDSARPNRHAPSWLLFLEGCLLGRASDGGFQHLVLQPWLQSPSTSISPRTCAPALESTS